LSGRYAPSAALDTPAIEAKEFQDLAARGAAVGSLQSHAASAAHTVAGTQP
jgi:hypothetical protein